MSEWKEYKLSEIATKITKGTTPSTLGSAFLDRGINFIKAEAITKQGKIDESTFAFISSLTHEKLKRSQLQESDILFSMAGVVLGKTAIVEKRHLPANTNQALALIRINQEMASPRYVKYFLSQKRIFDYVNTSTAQSAQPNINLAEIGSIKITLPALHIQYAISEILSSLDDKIDLNNKINKNFEDLAQAIFKQWFVDFEFPNENGEPYKSTGGEMVESELGEIPVGWKIKRLKEILTIKRGGSPRPIQDFIAESGLPWVKISDATAISTPFLFSTKEFIKNGGLKKTVLLKKGSLILSNSATPGLPKFLELDACIHDGWLYFQDIKDLSYSYLYLLFVDIRQNLIGQGNGSIFINLKTDILKDYPISIAEDKILSDFNKAIEPIFEQIRTLSMEVISLSRLRDLILPKLLSGEIKIDKSILPIEKVLSW